MSHVRNGMALSPCPLFLLGATLVAIAFLSTEVRAETPVTMDPTSHNFLQFGANPAFALGAYALPQGRTLEQGKAMGFHRVCTSADKTAWDNAQKTGPRV
jgi:hypothetical protein